MSHPYLHHPLKTIRISIGFGVSLFILMLFPLGGISFADTCTPPPATTPGVHEPTGSEAIMFSYQCTGPYAGKWLSAHFVFDPATNTETPLDSIVYTYNPATGLWDSPQWVFNAAKSIYQQITISVQTPPAGATTVGGPVAPSVSAPTTGDPSSSGDPSVNLTGNNTANLTNTLNATNNNNVLSNALTGSALVSGNTTGGSANSGNSTVIANEINMLQSTSNVLGDPNLLTFTANINGDVNGDLLLDPSKLGTIQPANANVSLNNNVTVNNSADMTMNNNVNLGSVTGDATVTNNTTGGNATTGNAKAVADIVNILNSAVNAGRSFVGIININGNLNGDILLPPNFVDTLLANNVPHYNLNVDLNNTGTVTNVNDAAIHNNIVTTANTGGATVSGNTTGGSAKTGSATTNLTVFNLTGSNVIASNDLLVFVNVLGQWYGMILNAPAGTTAASLGGGVSSVTANNNASLNNTNNQAINNNIDVSSRSGDAAVTNNTSGGNATSGDASSSVNLMNMINDNLSLNGWFGILFINVFGTWNGSFGINTSAGDPLTSLPGGPATPPQVFHFTPSSTPKATFTAYVTTVGPTGSTNGIVLAAHTSKHGDKTVGTTNTPSISSSHRSILLPALGGTLAIIILIVGERSRFSKGSK